LERDRVIDWCLASFLSLIRTGVFGILIERVKEIKRRKT
jgi:hypothetical protein